MSALEHVQRWARLNGLHLRLGRPQDDEVLAITRELVSVRVRDGVVPFAIPDGLVAFWRRHGGARLEHEEDEDYPNFIVNDFWVFSPDELVDLTARWARIPADVTSGERRVTTDHLVAFAAAGRSLADALWCFDVAEPTKGGEHPIVLGVVDAARYADDGERCARPSPTAPAFESFDAWLEDYAAGVCRREREQLHGFG